MDESPPRPPSAPPGMPRWVKAFLLVIGAIVVLLVVLAITGVLGGQHGPGRHLPSGRPSPAPVTEPPVAYVLPADRVP